MQPKIIGRESEIKILEKLLRSEKPELLAIYGRRRVGKTFLIRSYYQRHIKFSCTGQDKGKTREQLINFASQMNVHFPDRQVMLAPDSWQEAFMALRMRIESMKGPEKKVLFFDELPWLDNHKSGFLSAFGYFWNTYVEQRNDLLVVICGSAASWIINKIVNNKGGLHNRITQRMPLRPFTLNETKAYLQYRNINLEPYDILRLYMVLGGVPQYLNSVERGLSVTQNIEKICFSKNGALTAEFKNLYSALFNNPHKHIEVIRALALKNKGLTRSEILATGKIVTGGSITTVLTELEESGFIQRIFPFGKKEKDSLFRLADEFSLFYLKFMENPGGNQFHQSQAYTAWCGYSFENICIKHIEQVKKALQIGGVYTTISSWLRSGKGNVGGTQIDLLIDRADNCINICEIKFSTTPFVIEKKYAETLQTKMNVFRQVTATKKTLFLTFVTTYGVAENDYKTQRVDSEVTMDSLFSQ